jgi:hypothetical protein
MRNPARPDSAPNIIDGGEFSRQEAKEGLPCEKHAKVLSFNTLSWIKR